MKALEKGMLIACISKRNIILDKNSKECVRRLISFTIMSRYNGLKL